MDHAQNRDRRAVHPEDQAIVAVQQVPIRVAEYEACGHFEDYDIPWLRANAPYNRLAQRTLKVLDREADAFAAELLMPLAVVRYLRLDALDLQFYHCVSYSAAKGRLEYLDDPQWLEMTQYTARKILDHCKDYIELIITMRAVRGEI